jgi:hypothetical protein
MIVSMIVISCDTGDDTLTLYLLTTCKRHMLPAAAGILKLARAILICVRRIGCRWSSLSMGR